MDLAAMTPFFVFIAFLLLLLVSISAPTVKSLYLFQLAANVLGKNNSPVVVNFGVWGYCIPSIRVALTTGISKTTVEYCSPIRLGYTFDGTVANTLGVVRKIEDTISKTTTAAFVLHPIATCFAFLTLVTSLFILCRGKSGTARIASLLTFGLSILAVAFTTIVFLIDVITVAILRTKISDATRGAVTVNWGNAIWMTLTAAIALWVAVLASCCGICSRRRKQPQPTTY